jgi:hypothetical protein
MAVYSPDELYKRSIVLESHKELGNYLNADIINRLIHLFDNSIVNGNPKIIRYIANERNIRGLDDSITITCSVHFSKRFGYTLILDIKKNNRSIIHLTIHLVLHQLNPQNTGMIHFGKNIYNGKNTRSKKIKSYAIILVEPVLGKPNSLHFSIGDGYNTPHVKNANVYDPIIQQEMDVIITVLNRIFDENNNEFYIGKPRESFYNIHLTTNSILENMNKHTNIVTRKNKGHMMLPLFYNNTYFVINENVYKHLPKKNGKRVTSKRTHL